MSIPPPPPFSPSPPKSLPHKSTVNYKVHIKVPPSAPLPPPVPPPPKSVATKQITSNNPSNSVAKMMNLFNESKTIKLKEKDAYVEVAIAESVSIPKQISILKPTGEVDIGISGTIKTLRIVVWSDTHMAHESVILPKGDILIHCGDITNSGKIAEIEAFNAYVGRLEYKYKIAICGNHEVIIGSRSKEDIQKLLFNLIYLQDDSVEIEGIKIYGTPWTDAHGAFHAKKEERKQKWSNIPENVDILITHQPPRSILDKAYDPDEATLSMRKGVCKICHNSHLDYRHWGCNFLNERIRAIKPKVHVFGHVHDDFGACKVEDFPNTVFINAAVAFKKQARYFDFPTK